MNPEVITPAAGMIVSLEAAKLSLKEDSDDKDSLVTAWILGIEAYVEHYTGRAFVPRGMRLSLDAFPVNERGSSGVIFLDHPPTSSVESINYLDADGATQVLDPQDYVVDLKSEPACIVIGAGKAWPTTLDRIHAVWVDFTAGYGNGMPRGVELFALAKLSEQFDPAIRMEKDTVQSSFIDRLLDHLKVYG